MLYGLGVQPLVPGPVPLGDAGSIGIAGIGRLHVQGLGLNMTMGAARMLDRFPPGLARLALALIVSVLLAGCGSESRPPIKVSLSPWVGYDPLVLARDRRLLDAELLTIVEVGATTESLRALRNGVVDATALTLDAALRLAEEGVPIKIIALIAVSSGADAVLAGPAIAAPGQLRGKRIGVEEGSVGTLMLAHLLADAGLERSDLSVVRVEASHHEDTLMSGQVDAIITFEPMQSRLLAAGYHVIFDSRRMPDEILDALVVRAEVFDARPEAVSALLDGWMAGLAAFRASPQAAAGLLANGLGMSEEEYLATFSGLRFFELDESVELLTGGLERDRNGGDLASRWLEQEVIGRLPDWRQLLAPEPARRLLARREVGR